MAGVLEYIENTKVLFYHTFDIVSVRARVLTLADVPSSSTGSILHKPMWFDAAP